MRDHLPFRWVSFRLSQPEAISLLSKTFPKELADTANQVYNLALQKVCRVKKIKYRD